MYNVFKFLLLFIVPLAIVQAFNNDILAISLLIILGVYGICNKWLLNLNNVPSANDKLRLVGFMASALALWHWIIFQNWKSIELYYISDLTALLWALFVYLGFILYCFILYRTGWCLTLFKPNSKLSFAYEMTERKVQLHFSGTKTNLKTALSSFKLLLHNATVNDRINVIELISPILSSEKSRKKLYKIIDDVNNSGAYDHLLTPRLDSNFSPNQLQKLGYFLTFTIQAPKSYKQYWRNSKGAWSKINIVVTDKH
ncbi:hypothetical protein [Shewanella algicola]|uniref:hypothetical protein n=1 Tax=Shewanella algicola TaxID=640633 RepID=UPI002493FC54|nr:hypothetical protein [Shewanella algicola]